MKCVNGPSLKFTNRHKRNRGRPNPARPSSWTLNPFALPRCFEKSSSLISRFPHSPRSFLISLHARESSSPTPRQAGKVDLFGPRQRPRVSASPSPAHPPLVLAQDNKPWKSSTRFADLIAVPEGAGEEIQKHIPDFEFQLVELCRMPFEKILGTPMGILTLRALKAEKLEAL